MSCFIDRCDRRRSWRLASSATVSESKRSADRGSDHASLGVLRAGAVLAVSQNKERIDGRCRAAPPSSDWPPAREQDQDESSGLLAAVSTTLLFRGSLSRSRQTSPIHRRRPLDRRSLLEACSATSSSVSAVPPRRTRHRRYAGVTVGRQPNRVQMSRLPQRQIDPRLLRVCQTMAECNLGPVFLAVTVVPLFAITYHHVGLVNNSITCWIGR